MWVFLSQNKVSKKNLKNEVKKFFLHKENKNREKILKKP